MSTALPLLEYPFRTAIARKVHTVFGATNTRELVFNRAASVVKQTDGQASKHNAHHFMQHTDDTLTEYARQVYTASADGKSAEWTLGLLQTKGDGSQELSTALKATPTGVNISGVSLTPNSLSYDSTAGAIYFGGPAKTWRIILSGTDDDLSFEYKDAQGNYVPKVLMTKED